MSKTNAVCLINMVVKHSSWLIILFLNYFPVFQDEQVPKFVQISPERYTNLTESEEQVKILCDKVNVLNEKLSAAQSDITTKDSLVKQHVKVAEEAVSGLKLIAAILYFFFCWIDYWVNCTVSWFLPRILNLVISIIYLSNYWRCAT